MTGNDRETEKNPATQAASGSEAVSLSQIRNRINALRRKYALPLAVNSLRPLAEEFCQQWAVAQADRKPAPEPQPFIRKIASAGFRLPTFMELHKYIERCRHNNTCPDVKGVIRCLLPRAAELGCLEALRWDRATT